MGVTDSRMQQVTPSRPLVNRHLSRVIDPRSPTAGIPRTPIEVAESPQRSPAPEEEIAQPAIINDPRSPTQGIVRTPLRPSLHASLNLLAKQLSEVFVTEDSGIEDSPEANKETPAETPEDQPASDALLPPAEEEVKVPESVEEALMSPSVAPVEPTPPTVHPQKPRSKSPRPAGAKNVRQRPRKALVSNAHARSPLKILQEDNSPSTAVQNRQVKIIPFQSEQPSVIRNLKISHCGWEISHNKENAQYTRSES